LIKTLCHESQSACDKALKATGQQAAPAIGKPGLLGRLKAHCAVDMFVDAPNTVSAAMPGEIVACKEITIFKTHNGLNMHRCRKPHSCYTQTFGRNQDKRMKACRSLIFKQPASYKLNSCRELTVRQPLRYSRPGTAFGNRHRPAN